MSSVDATLESLVRAEMGGEGPWARTGRLSRARGLARRLHRGERAAASFPAAAHADPSARPPAAAAPLRGMTMAPHRSEGVASDLADPEGAR